MKLGKVIAVCLIAAICGSFHSAFAQSSVGDFALLDHQGKLHQLSYYGDHQAVVMVAHQLDKTTAEGKLSLLKSLRSDPANNKAVFLFINTTDDRDQISIDSAASDSDIPVLIDEARLVSETLGLSGGADAVVIDPGSMTMLYRGVADESIAAAIAGDASRIAGNAASTDSTASYARDIVPILQNNCVSCHHDGGIGPWSMSSHGMIKGWSKMMREVVMTRRMPPGQIDQHVGKAIQETAGLTAKEQRTLVHWIDAGAPMDADQQDPLKDLRFENPRYTLGEPDIILKVPAQTIPATGVIDYRYVPVELNLERDVWVRAMETIPGDRQVLHHVIAYVSSPADKTVRGRQTGAANGESLGGFAPGRQPDVFRDDSGRLLSKGSNLLLQMHYTTSGKETVDETEIGLYIYDQPPTHVMAGGVAGQRRFLIPPHAKEHKLEGEQLIERDAYLYSLMPHMHYRGKYMRYSAVYPDGSSEILLSVPRYEFNWQFNYQLVEPLFLPAGTRLVANGAMDNSARNPFNPDPDKPVHFGLQTKHEMFFGFTTLRYIGDSPQHKLAGR